MLTSVSRGTGRVRASGPHSPKPRIAKVAVSRDPRAARLHAKRDHVLSTKHETFTGKVFAEVPGMMRVEPHSEPSAAANRFQRQVR